MPYIHPELEAMAVLAMQVARERNEPVYVVMDKGQLVNASYNELIKGVVEPLAMVHPDGGVDYYAQSAPPG
jgi:hypothetical protein